MQHHEQSLHLLNIHGFDGLKCTRVEWETIGSILSTYKYTQKFSTTNNTTKIDQCSKEKYIGNLWASFWPYFYREVRKIMLRRSQSGLRWSVSNFDSDITLFLGEKESFSRWKKLFTSCDSSAISAERR